MFTCTSLNFSSLIIEVINCLHRLPEKCNICDNYYKRKGKLTWSWYCCDKTTEADKGQSQNIIAGTSRLCNTIKNVRKEEDFSLPCKLIAPRKQVEIIRQLTTPRDGSRKFRKRGPSPPPPNENCTFQDMQHTALWAYSWCKVKKS